jgi:ethanolamine ammonia-lyase small subunit
MPALARLARVGIDDQIAVRTGAGLVVVLIGERPGG